MVLEAYEGQGEEAEVSMEAPRPCYVLIEL